MPKQALAAAGMLLAAVGATSCKRTSTVAPTGVAAETASVATPAPTAPRSASIARTAPHYAPYGTGTPAQASANDIYNLLFCDDLAAFAPKGDEPPIAWKQVLFSEPADTVALRALADDVSQEGRVRYMAFTKRRERHEAVPPKVLLGVIVEVPLDGGLDVIAAYSDGAVRYINHSSKMAILEGVESVQPLVQQLFAAASVAIAPIGPSNQPRKPPPKADEIRVSFLVSDGFYFGEGPSSAMYSDPMSGPVVQRAGQIVMAVVKLHPK